MATGTGAAILGIAEHLEKWPGQIDFPGGAERLHLSGRVFKREEIW
jgi:hypothetical protein